MTDPSWKTQKTKPRSLPFASAGAELLFSAHLPLPGRGENDHPLNTHLPTHVSAQHSPPAPTSGWPLLPTGLGAQGVSTSVAVRDAGGSEGSQVDGPLRFELLRRPLTGPELELAPVNVGHEAVGLHGEHAVQLGDHCTKPQDRAG